MKPAEPSVLSLLIGTGVAILFVMGLAYLLGFVA